MSNQHYPLSMQAYLAILGSNTQDEAQEKIKDYYPRYNPCDDTLLTPFDTAFKDAVVDQHVPIVKPNCIKPKEVEVIPDHPFTWECLPHCAGMSGAIEHLTRSS